VLIANLFWVYRKGKVKRALEKACSPSAGLPKPGEQKLLVLQPGSISPPSLLFLTVVDSVLIAPGEFIAPVSPNPPAPCVQHVDGSPVKHGHAQISLQERQAGTRQAGLPVMLRTPGSVVPQYSGSCRGCRTVWLEQPLSAGPPVHAHAVGTPAGPTRAHG